MHIADVEAGNLGATGVVGGGLATAVGAALSIKMRGTDQVTLCFFGDGAANMGIFHESLNLAAIWELPVVFVCENNRYAMSMSVERALPIQDVADRAAAYAMPGVVVDGNDVLAVYEKAVEAVERARRGQGPSLIEAVTYRWYGHGASDNRSYRTREEEQQWKEKCPVLRFKSYLLEKEIMAQEQLDSLEDEVKKEKDEAVEYALDMGRRNAALHLGVGR